MSDTATAPATTDLGTYDGLDILGTTVSIRNAGDGLSDSMKVEPVKLPIHSTVHVVLECEVVKHTHEEIKDTDGLQLVNVLKAGRATIISREQVATALDVQQRKIDEHEGNLQLDLDGDSNGQRGGDPQTVGQVLDDAIDLAADADREGDWRNQRHAELVKKKKAELVEIADLAGIESDGFTKAELIGEILDDEDPQDYQAGDHVPF